MPSALFRGPSDPATPTVNGLAQFGNPDYEHRYYVDATPLAFDIDFNYAAGVKTTTNGDELRLAHGGDRRPGQGRQELLCHRRDQSRGHDDRGDRARTRCFGSSPTATMGYSFGAPLVIKTPKYGWVVVFTSGYVDGNASTTGYIYFVDPRNRQLARKGGDGNGRAGPGTGHGLHQGLHRRHGRCDLRRRPERSDVALRCQGDDRQLPGAAAAGDGGRSGDGRNAQPITSQPLVEIDPKTRKRYVMFGTGQLLDTIDINTSGSQTFYAFIDGTATAFGTSSGLPSGVSYPLTRANLTGISVDDLISATALDFANKVGWYIDLGSTNSVAWRAVSNRRPTAASWRSRRC